MAHLQKIKVNVPKKVKDMIKDSKYVSIDVGCGAYKRKGSIGMDIRPLPGVDIVHDINQYPWPLPDEEAKLITANHVIEHIPKWGASPQIDKLAKLLIKKGVLSQKDVNSVVGETQIFSYLMRFMDECWRVMKPGGQLAMVFPYAGSHGFHQDPTHAAPINEATFFYFDPEHYTKLWHIYKPKPWEIEVSVYQVNGNMEVVLSKRAMKPEYDEANYA